MNPLPGTSMPSTDDLKLKAAQAASDLVHDGMAVGLGSGSTATLLIQLLGQRVRDHGLRIVGAPTSVATAKLAESYGIPLMELDDREHLDINIDGADEVDPAYNIIKGLGGALLREKLVAAAARRRVFIVGDNKLVPTLGDHCPVPIEVSPFGLEHTAARLKALGCTPLLRKKTDGSPFATDGGNRILDCQFGLIPDPAALDAKLQSVTGVFETGLFLGFVDTLIVGHSGSVEVIDIRK